MSGRSRSKVLPSSSDAMTRTISAAAASARLTLGAPRRRGGSACDDGVGIGEEGLEAFDDQTLELDRRQALPRVRDPVCSPRFDVRDQPARDIVAIAHALLDRVRRRHRFALGVEQNAGQQIGLLRLVARDPPLDAVGFELLLNLPTRAPRRRSAGCSPG